MGFSGGNTTQCQQCNVDGMENKCGRTIIIFVDLDPYHLWKKKKHLIICYWTWKTENHTWIPMAE